MINYVRKVNIYSTKTHASVSVYDGRFLAWLFVILRSWLYAVRHKQQDCCCFVITSANVN